MALTVSQYNSILRQYEEHQTRNRHLHDQRQHHIYETGPGYQALDEAVASTSVAQGVAASGKAVQMYEITIEHLSGKEVQEK